ncbi:MAG: hypothetical protein OEY91_08010 [Nitrospirota bacterium]|nr:hypothetical protein [Nitrospirota bacterium]
MTLKALTTIVHLKEVLAVTQPVAFSLLIPKGELLSVDSKDLAYV